MSHFHNREITVWYELTKLNTSLKEGLEISTANIMKRLSKKNSWRCYVYTKTCCDRTIPREISLRDMASFPNKKYVNVGKMRQECTRTTKHLMVLCVIKCLGFFSACIHSKVRFFMHQEFDSKTFRTKHARKIFYHHSIFSDFIFKN